MMTLKNIYKILILSLILASSFRFGLIQLTNYNKDRVAKDVCSLVALPLQTSSLRTAYEGMQSALQKMSKVKACISILDGGRSYSPNCIQDQVSYRTTYCKVEGNTSVLASISYEEENFFKLEFLLLFVLNLLIIASLILLVKGLAKIIIFELSMEIKNLLNFETNNTKNLSFAQKIIRYLLLKTGISNILEAKTEDIKLNFQKYENQIKSETAKKVRLEIDQKKNQDYIEKVKQIRHDIRSPLSSIQSAYEFLNKNDLPSKSIATAIRRIQILIDDLNQVDRVLEESKFLIAEVSLEEIVLVLKSKFKSQKNADLVFKYNEDSLTAIKVREQDFMSAVENLLENSLDAIGVNGKVLIKVENQNQSCIITVEDSGSGVRSENISNLFSKGATFDKANGIGLGLYNTKKIIESFGGNIRYIEQSQGAKFEIKLPIVQTGVVFVSLPKNQTMKVIDDDSFIPESLKKLGYPISQYVNTFEAGKVLLVENQSDDELILVDNRLGLNKFGTELIGQQLRRKNIILCTNDFDDMDLIKQAKAIGVKVLPKPLIFLRQAEAVSSPTNPI